MSDIDAGVTTSPPRITNTFLNSTQVSSQTSTDSHMSTQSHKTSTHPHELTGESLKEALADMPNINATLPIASENSSSSSVGSTLGFGLPVTSCIGFSLPVTAATGNDMPPLISAAALVAPNGQQVAPPLQSIAPPLQSVAPNLQSVLFPPVIMSTGISGDSLFSAKRPPVDLKNNGKAAQNLNAQSKPAVDAQKSNSASELATQLETKVHDKLVTHVSEPQTTFPAGVLASQALALARTASNVANPTKLQSRDSEKDPEQDRSDVSKEPKHSQSTIPSIYSPQMVQAGKSTMIPLRTPGFPFVNPFLPVSTGKSEGDTTPKLATAVQVTTAGAKTTSVCRPPENVSNTIVLSSISIRLFI